MADQPIYSPFFGVMGATSAMVFSAMGAAYGTAKSGTGKLTVMIIGRDNLSCDEHMVCIESFDYNTHQTLKSSYSLLCAVRKSFPVALCLLNPKVFVFCLQFPIFKGIAAMAVMRPEAIMKSIIPVVMAGIIAIYGVVVAVLIAGQLSSTGYTLYQV